MKKWMMMRETFRRGEPPEVELRLRWNILKDAANFMKSNIAATEDSTTIVNNFKLMDALGKSAVDTFPIAPAAPIQITNSNQVPPSASASDGDLGRVEDDEQATPTTIQLLKLKSEDLVRILKDSLAELGEEERHYHAQIVQKKKQNEELKVQLRNEDNINRNLNVDLCNDDVRLILENSMATRNEDLVRLRIDIERLDSKIQKAKKTADLKVDELEGWKIRAAEASDECLLLQEKFSKSTLKSSELRKNKTEMHNDTVNWSNRGLPPPQDHGHNMPPETVTIESDSDDEIGETRNIRRSEPSGPTSPGIQSQIIRPGHGQTTGHWSNRPKKYRHPDPYERTRSLPLSSRHEFYEHDDKLIVDYLVRYKLHKDCSLHSQTWKRMHSDINLKFKKSHTPASLATRYRDFIWPNLLYYLPNHEAAKFLEISHSQMRTPRYIKYMRRNGNGTFKGEPAG